MGRPNLYKRCQSNTSAPAGQHSPPYLEQVERRLVPPRSILLQGSGGVRVVPVSRRRRNDPPAPAPDAEPCRTPQAPGKARLQAAVNRLTRALGHACLLPQLVCALGSRAALRLPRRRLLCRRLALLAAAALAAAVAAAAGGGIICKHRHQLLRIHLHLPAVRQWLRVWVQVAEQAAARLWPHPPTAAAAGSGGTLSQLGQVAVQQRAHAQGVLALGIELSPGLGPRLDAAGTRPLLRCRRRAAGVRASGRRRRSGAPTHPPSTPSGSHVLATGRK